MRNVKHIQVYPSKFQIVYARIDDPAIGEFTGESAKGVTADEGETMPLKGSCELREGRVGSTHSCHECGLKKGIWRILSQDMVE